MRPLHALLIPALLAAVSSLAGPAVAQSLPGIVIPSAAPLGLPNSPGIRQEGLYVTAPIRLDGGFLFRVAAAGSAAGTITAIEERQQVIEAALGQLVSGVSSGSTVGTVYSPTSLRISIHTQDGQDYLVATDRNHPNALPILTVTSVDGKYNKESVDALASSWQSVLQSALVAALQKRQPAQIARNYNDLIRVAVALVVVTLLLWMLFTIVKRRIDSVRTEVESNDRAIDRISGDGSPLARLRFVATSLSSVEPAQRLSILRAFSAFIVWFGVLLWVVAVAWALLLFPQTIIAGQVFLRSIIRVALIWTGLGLVDKLLDVIIVRVAGAYRIRESGANEEETRRALRAPTVARAIRESKTVLLIFVAILTTLGELGIPIGSVVTIGGIVALAVTFAAQNLVRDCLNGALVLFEDQYVLGDYIEIGEWSGIVEHLTLRIVQIRDGRGNLITIPHSSAIQVVNASRNWSRIDYRIAVDPSADLTGAVSRLRATIETLATEEAWRDAMIEPVEWIGVESLSRTAVVLRVSIKTAPLRQFELRREINARVFAAFAEAKISFGVDPGTTTVSVPVGSPDPQ